MCQHHQRIKLASDSHSDSDKACSACLEFFFYFCRASSQTQHHLLMWVHLRIRTELIMACNGVHLRLTTLYGCPLQGHNQIIAYSRAAYFCMLCGLIWILELKLKRSDLPVFTLYGITVVMSDTLRFVQDVLIGEYYVSKLCINFYTFFLRFFSQAPKSWANLNAV